MIFMLNAVMPNDYYVKYDFESSPEPRQEQRLGLQGEEQGQGLYRQGKYLQKEKKNYRAQGGKKKKKKE